MVNFLSPILSHFHVIIKKTIISCTNIAPFIRIKVMLQIKINSDTANERREKGTQFQSEEAAQPEPDDMMFLKLRTGP